MQRRLTIALVATALVSILLVGFGVLAMAQLSATSNAEREVTRGLNVLSDFIDGPSRSQRQVEGLLFGSRTNLGLDLLESVTVDDDGGVAPVPDRQRPEISRDFPKIRLQPDEIEALDRGDTVLISDNRAVHGLREVTFQRRGGSETRRISILASSDVRAVTRQTMAWFLVSSLAVLAGALLGGIWLARRFSRPIKDIQSATAAIAAGDLDVRVKPTGSDEVADLGHEVNRMAADLQRSKALDRQFLMSVSHDLKTPLTAIAGYAEALSDGAVTNTRSAGEVIGNHADRLERLVGDLLDLARLDANRFQLNPRPFDLAVVAGRTVAGLGNQAGQHGLTLFRDGLESVTVIADSDRTAQAIGNLIDNAIKFARSTVQVTIATDDDMAVVSVRDDGPGIANQDLPHIFDRLYTGRAQPDRAENPTGLGLAIVRELAGAMGGRVHADNHPEGGALLSLALPISREHGSGEPGSQESGGREPREHVPREPSQDSAGLHR